MDTSHWTDLVKPIFAGRRWLIVSQAVAPATPLIHRLAEHGADTPFVIAAGPGFGELPAAHEAEIAYLGTSGATIMEGYRRFEAQLRDLPPEVQTRVEVWDPDGTARVVGGFLRSDRRVAGRTPFGARRPEWEALENKVTIDALWDAAGIDRAPSEIVPAERSHLAEAAHRLDAGTGTVWTADNRDGWHGAAEFVRWVTDDDSEAAAFMEGHCEAVRVMPFLDGLPCSIHGVVFDSTVLTLRPVENLILRQPGRSTLRYAGVATHWVPGAGDLEYLRTVAQTVGDHLRATLGYRGAFGIDGVMTADGWFPTELNPRGSVGFGTLTSLAEDFDFASLNWALSEGLDLDYRPHDLQVMLRTTCAESGRGGGMAVVNRKTTEPETHPIVFEGDDALVAGDADEPDAELGIGPHSTGGLVRVTPAIHRTAFGKSYAPRTAAALRLADRLWNLELGRLEPAPVLR